MNEDKSDAVSDVTRQLIERDQAGRKKYGTSLDRSDLSLADWLQHMAEELLDAAGYALAAKRTALSAQQPPAEAQPVAWEWEYVGNDPSPRGKTVARALHEMDPQNPPYPETWRPTRPLVYGDASPQQPPAEAQAQGGMETVGC